MAVEVRQVGPDVWEPAVAVSAAAPDVFRYLADFERHREKTSPGARSTATPPAAPAPPPSTASRRSSARRAGRPGLAWSERIVSPWTSTGGDDAGGRHRADRPGVVDRRHPGAGRPQRGRPLGHRWPPALPRRDHRAGRRPGPAGHSAVRSATAGRVRVAERAGTAVAASETTTVAATSTTTSTTGTLKGIDRPSRSVPVTTS